MFSNRLSDVLSSLIAERIVRKWLRILARLRDERGVELVGVLWGDFAGFLRFRFTGRAG